jgi:hypothetical protein
LIDERVNEVVLNTESTPLCYDEILEALDNGEEAIIAIFLDISKAFDRVWHRVCSVNYMRLASSE